MTRAATLAAMPLVVQDSAMPISTPVPSVIIAALVARRGDGEAHRVEQRAEDGDAARPEAIDQRAGERLRDAPDDVLHGNRHGEIGRLQPEVLHDGRLEQTEALPQPHGDRQHDGGARQDQHGLRRG